MRLRELQIHNYKSLRDIAISPSPLTVLVGPNAAGKSNFCDALDFLGEAYRLGLEIAVARKGGYENICYRRVRRSKAPIRFQIEFELDWDEWRWPFLFRKHEVFEHSITAFKHTFEIGVESESIKAPFYIVSESLEVRLKRKSGPQLRLPLLDDGLDQSILMACSREGKNITHLDFQGLKELTEIGEEPPVFLALSPDLTREELKGQLPETEFLLSFVFRGLWGGSPFQRTIGSVRVFQLSPRNCRESGVPTPNPELDRFGGNLPAVVEYLKSHFQERYYMLLETVRRVMPTLQDLETQYTHRKTLGLLVSEEGFGRPWAAEDVSDGTIQTVALLVAALDPRTHIVAIEEPENSVHPWAIRNFINVAREASRSKQVILTTHSPVLIDKLKPSELWVVRRPEAETMIDQVLSLDSSVENALGQGQFTLSEYLDSGVIREAVP